MQADIQKVLVDRDTIARRLDQLADEICRDLQQLDGPDHNELTLVPILTGSIIFVSDLMRRLPLRMQIHLMGITSYPGTAMSSKGATIRKGLTNLPTDLSDRHVLLIDDILDSGSTLRLAVDELESKRPASLRTCVLLRKQRPEAMDFDVDYVAFDIPDEFVVGYGLDYDDYYRNLPEIVTLNKQAIERQQHANDT